MILKFQAREMLREIFRRAYQEKESLEVGEIDKQAIMDQIRKRGRLPLQSFSFLENFERFVWRLAPGVCFSIFLLMVLGSIFPAFDFLNKNGRYGLLEGGSAELRLEQLFEATRSDQ
jgi:hypothetical protein